ncbi:hypothetical protein EJ04DRAFT_483284 [Polyplosphaeria fusca]|uniref:F-box domain-containing protein n=1 Tax=Polyplosphaeria fusca TaxID=682080 RepID=A0A9P4R9T7_9PLEO|nr:hypothetical protein EJ04DRAFT_483284 [Polyplosphaeria fusca]
MAKLVDLPLELLVLLYLCLDSIDDVHHLARACQATYRAIQMGKTYVTVMRSVIRTSPAHRFDIQLCRLLVLHRQIAAHLANGGAPLPPTQLPPPGSTMTYQNLNDWERHLLWSVADKAYLADRESYEAVLNDERVYDILARWQGVRELQHVWLSKETGKEDHLSVSFTGQAEQLAHAFERVQQTANEDGESRYSNAVRYASFNDAQVGRFYAATTRIWIMNEIRWVLAHLSYPQRLCRYHTMLVELCMNRLQEQTKTPLLDHLDMLSMYSFLYQHLLPLHLPALADQCSSKLPLTYSSDVNNNPRRAASFLQLCLLAGQTYLQPPDLIELAIRNKRSHRAPFPSPHPSQSTLDHIQPSRILPFPPGLNLLPSLAPQFYLLTTIGLQHVHIMQRSSVTQIRLNPITPSDPQAHLWAIPDFLEDYLEKRAIGQFDTHADHSKQDISNVWTKNWEEIRWSIWWWADSDDKARAKMERWREE